jgi:hypothetical protein
MSQKTKPSPIRSFNLSFHGFLSLMADAVPEKLGKLVPIVIAVINAATNDH